MMGVEPKPVAGPANMPTLIPTCFVGVKGVYVCVQ